MSRSARADICYNIRQIKITSKDHGAFWTNSDGPENWNRNGWIWLGDSKCGDNGRLYCDDLSKGKLIVNVIRQDPYSVDDFVLCSDDDIAIIEFLNDWNCDISTNGIYKEIDAIWQII